MSQKSIEETIVKMAIEGATNGEIAKTVGLEVKIVAAITGHYRNLIMAKRYERSGRFFVYADNRAFAAFLTQLCCEPLKYFTEF